MTKNNSNLPSNNPKLAEILIVFFTLIGFLFLNVIIIKASAASGPNQIAFLLVSTLTGFLAWRRGVSWKSIEKGIIDNIGEVFPNIIILLLVGAVIGTWTLSGIVPAFIYYGLELIHPKVFLVTVCIISAVISTIIGSSWTTTATVGIALMSVGVVLGIKEEYIAGAIISGAYFGDKLSPFSDTTNVAASISDVKLFTHIRYMTYTSFPVMGITLLIFLLWGFGLTDESNVSNITKFQNELKQIFYISPLSLVVPLGIFYLLYKRIPAIPVLFIGALAGSIFALIFQTNLVLSMSHLEGVDFGVLHKMLEVTIRSWYGTIQFEVKNEVIKNLLHSNGMFGMLNTIWLLTAAISFGGILKSGGYLSSFIFYIAKLFEGKFKLILLTTGTCIIFSGLMSNQSVSIIIPGQLFKSLYAKLKLAPENLSRTLEDSATTTSVLIPWNTCGIFHSTTLGIATLAYLPYCFFNLLSPISTLIFSYFKIKIKKLKE